MANLMSIYNDLLKKTKNALLSSVTFVLNGVCVANGISPDKYELTEPQIKQTYKQTMLV